jgi:hypothetical protein
MELCPNSTAIRLLLQTHEPRHAHPSVFVQQQMDNGIVIICFHLSSFVCVCGFVHPQNAKLVGRGMDLSIFPLLWKTHFFYAPHTLFAIQDLESLRQLPES